MSIYDGADAAARDHYPHRSVIMRAKAFVDRDDDLASAIAWMTRAVEAGREQGHDPIELAFDAMMLGDMHLRGGYVRAAEEAFELAKSHADRGDEDHPLRSRIAEFLGVCRSIRGAEDGR